MAPEQPGNPPCSLPPPTPPEPSAPQAQGKAAGLALPHSQCPSFPVDATVLGGADETGSPTTATENAGHGRCETGRAAVPAGPRQDGRPNAVPSPACPELRDHPA